MNESDQLTQKICFFPKWRYRGPFWCKLMENGSGYISVMANAILLKIYEHIHYIQYCDIKLKKLELK